jgi:hypothetical protein
MRSNEEFQRANQATLTTSKDYAHERVGSSLRKHQQLPFFLDLVAGRSAYEHTHRELGMLQLPMPVVFDVDYPRGPTLIAVIKKSSTSQLPVPSALRESVQSHLLSRGYNSASDGFAFDFTWLVTDISRLVSQRQSRPKHEHDKHRHHENHQQEHSGLVLNMIYHSWRFPSKEGSKQRGAHAASVPMGLFTVKVTCIVSVYVLLYSSLDVDRVEVYNKHHGMQETLPSTRSLWRE